MTAQAEKKAKRPRCPTCGKFMRQDRDDPTKWQCIYVFWDDYAGGYEHG